MQHLVFPHVLRIDKRGRTLTASIRSETRVLSINVALQQATTSEPLATVRAGVTPLPPVGGANMSAKVLALGIGPRKIFIYTGSTQAIHFYYNKYFLSFCTRKAVLRSRSRWSRNHFEDPEPKLTVQLNFNIYLVIYHTKVRSKAARMNKN